MPGRDFTSPADFNAQFADWLAKREHPDGAHHQGPPGRSARRRPGRDAAAATGPACARAGVNRVRLGRDYYVRLDTSDYSVDPTVIGRIVDVTADLDRVRGPRSRAASSPTTPGSGPAGMTITDPAHVATAAVLRAAVPATPRTTDRATRTWSGTWPTTTAPSASSTATARSRDGRPRRTTPRRRSSRSTTSPPR